MILLKNVYKYQDSYFYTLIYEIKKAFCNDISSFILQYLYELK